MKKTKQGILGGFQRFSTEDGPGIRTTLFFKGCPLNCKWCHNPELISSHYEILYSPQRCIACGLCAEACPENGITLVRDEEGQMKIHIDRKACTYCCRCTEACCTEALRAAGERRSKEEVIDLLMRDRGFYEETGGGVTFSGGEVMSQAEYAEELMDACIEKGLSVTLDTCGYGRIEDLLRMGKKAQCILYDLKMMDSEEHKKLTGVDTELIHSNLRTLCQDDEIRSKIVIRIPLIHPFNDSIENMEAVCKLMKELRIDQVNILPYHTLGTSKSRSLGKEAEEFQTPSDEALHEIKGIFDQYDLHLVIMGNEETA